MSKHAYQTEQTKKSPLKYSPSFREFLESIRETCKVARCLLEAGTLYRYCNPELPMNYISFRDSEGMISFMPAGREQRLNENGTWSTQGRQTTRPVKFARSILHPRVAESIKDHEFAAFAARFKANELSNEISFKIVSVKEGYRKDGYSIDISSCMAGKPVHRFYDMYDCKVLVAVKKGRYIARALLWNEVFLDTKETPIKLMDRVYYANCNGTCQLFIDWAIENGYHRKQNQNGYSDEPIVSPTGEVVNNPILRVYKKTNAKERIYKPYLDTLEYTDHNYKILSNIFRVANTVYYNLKSAENYRENKKEFVLAHTSETNSGYVHKGDTLKFKGELYYKLCSLCCVAENGLYYHKQDPRVFSFLRGYYTTFYLKKTHVVVDGKVYRKTDPRIIQAGNNKWILKEEIKIEPIKDVKVDTNNASKGFMDVGIDTISQYFSQWFSITPPVNTINYDITTDAVEDVLTTRE